MAPELPQALLHSLQQVEGFDEASFRHVHEGGEQVVSIRYHPMKVDRIPNDHFESTTRVPWSMHGYYLPTRPSFTLDPWWHAGAYYVQEASGMFLEQCLRQTIDLSQPLKVLDLCAAPGGKSTLLQSMLSGDSLLVSNEAIRSRVGALTENTIRWGGANVIVTHNDPADFARLPSYFDVMVVDAPCSGSGLFRREPEAIRQWSPDAVDMCSLRQQRILSNAYGALKENGLLVYCTCSFSSEENEEVCDWLCDRFSVTPLAITVDDEGITQTHSRENNVPGYRFFPDKIRGEGFFVACFRKQETSETPAALKKNKLVRLNRSELPALQGWVKDVSAMDFYHHQQSVLAFPASLEQELAVIGSSLYIRRAGVVCGKLAQGSLVPDHELAVSVLAGNELFILPVDRQQALQYLRKEELHAAPHGKGWALVTYQGMHLGWVKQLGNRTNNYYPKEWRILKTGNS